jgi:hypothetical protein
MKSFDEAGKVDDKTQKDFDNNMEVFNRRLIQMLGGNLELGIDGFMAALDDNQRATYNRLFTEGLKEIALGTNGNVAAGQIIRSYAGNGVDFNFEILPDQFDTAVKLARLYGMESGDDEQIFESAGRIFVHNKKTGKIQEVIADQANVAPDSVMSQQPAQAPARTQVNPLQRLIGGGGLK